MRLLARSLIVLVLVPLAGAQDEFKRFYTMFEELPFVTFDTAHVGDLDADGDPDLYFSGRTKHVVARNAGVGPFADDAVLDDVHGVYERRLLLEDFDGDTLPDLLVLRTYQRQARFRVYFNPGDGAFLTTTASELPSTGTFGFTGARAGDVDGDGDVDLVAYCPGRSASQFTPEALLLNDGGGSFTLTRAGLPASIGSNQLHLADLDGDGRLDVVRFSDGWVRIWANLGGGRFVEPSVQPGVARHSGADYLQVADLTGDGLPDLLADNPPHVLVNLGNGRFSDRGEALPLLRDSYPTLPAYATSPADLDGDGRADVIVRTQLDPLPRVHLNRGSHFEQRLGALPDPSALGAGLAFDVDGDGDLDLFGMNPERSLWLNDGRGGFRNFTSPDWETGSYEVVERTTDFDGDGFLDFATCDVSSGLRAEFRNDRGGGFAVVPTCQVPGGCKSIRWLDLDADGDEDVLRVATTLEVQRQDGPCVFTSVPLPPSAGRLEWVGDFDVDGLPDLLTSTLSTTALLRNTGAAVFDDVSGRLPAMPRGVWFQGTGDVEGDGDPDLFRAGPDPTMTADLGFYLWRNASGTAFTEELVGFADGEQVFSLLPIDFEGDGDLDVFALAGWYFDWAGEVDAYLFRNDGTSFVDVTASWTGGDVGFGMSALDFDGDGDTDLVHADTAWLNDGTGAFTPITAAGKRYNLVDLDGDGDLDYWTGSRFYHNLDRHLAWRAVPRVGKPLDLELHGPALARYAVFVSPRMGAGVATRHGLFLLDPTEFQLGELGTLDASGEAYPSFQVPNDLSLLGHSGVFQALTGGRFTNAQHATLLSY